MTDELKGKRIFVWRGRDLDDDVRRLAEAIAEACISRLFNLNQNLVWLDQGLPVPISRNQLAGIISKSIAGVRLVEVNGDWKCEYFQFDFSPTADTSKAPNDQVLTSLMEELKQLVAKGPRAAAKLTEQQKQDITSRLKTGEPRSRVAEHYHLDLEQLEEVRRLTG